MADEGSGEGPSASELVFYQGEDGKSRIQVRLEGGTVWLTQVLLAELFQTTKQNISLHIKNIFEEGELDPSRTVKQYLTVQAEGTRSVRRVIDHYNLEVTLAVGYRVRSDRGTQFRRWATERLREYLVKGFVLDDARLKTGKTVGDDYFDELLARIRDIRASEKRFYGKIRDLYALERRAPPSPAPRSREGLHDGPQGRAAAGADGKYRANELLDARQPTRRSTHVRRRPRRRNPALTPPSTSCSSFPPPCGSSSPRSPWPRPGTTCSGRSSTPCARPRHSYPGAA